MPVKRINQDQLRYYMENRNDGHTQKVSGLKAGISERTGRRIEKGEISSESKRKVTWRTREDPFEKVWTNELKPMLEVTPALSPMTLLEYLQKKYPGKYPDSKQRTLQRRVKKWKALYGPEKEVMFRQIHHPGQVGLSDFTTLTGTEILIKGEKLDHRLYHFRLACSGWCDGKVILGGESYAALSEGLQNALWKLGGAPKEHRTDSLAAAYKNLSKDEQEDLTKRYQAFCDHYGMTPTRNNRGESHENGSIESPHGHLKARMRQALLLRQSNEFESVSEYQVWLNEVTRSINDRRRDKIKMERGFLQPLPLKRTSDYTEKIVRVTSSSTIDVKRVLYTVPSRLIGENLRLHIHDDRIEGWLGTVSCVTLPRIYTPNKNHRARCVDYRHVIRSLERKPGAFRNSQIRDDLLPNDTYRSIWKWLDKVLEPRKASKLMVGILSLADRADCQEGLEVYLEKCRGEGRVPSMSELTGCFENRIIRVPDLGDETPSASVYDELLSGNHLQGVN